MVHAGHSQQLPLLKADTLLSMALKLFFLSNRWLTVQLLAVHAMADGLLVLCNMFKRLVDKCQLLHTLIEEFRVVADSALDQFKRKLLLFLVYMMPRALLLQAQLPSILMPLIVSNHTEEVFLMASVENIIML